jgi:hypothetical protein
MSSLPNLNDTNSSLYPLPTGKSVFTNQKPTPLPNTFRTFCTNTTPQIKDLNLLMGPPPPLPNPPLRTPKIATFDNFIDIEYLPQHDDPIHANSPDRQRPRNNQEAEERTSESFYLPPNDEEKEGSLARDNCFAKKNLTPQVYIQAHFPITTQKE